MTELEQDMTIKEFCNTHNACNEGRDWAIANCKNMAECWEKLPSDYLIWTATRTGVLSEKELRLFAVFCCREIWSLLTDERSQNAVEVTEKFSIGQATTEELQVAAYAAARAADDAARAAYAAARAADDAARAADAAARAAAYAARAADDAASDATAYAASDAAAYAASDAAAYAARDAARAAARQKQADWLRANTTPNFKRIATNDRA